MLHVSMQCINGTDLWTCDSLIHPASHDPVYNSAFSSSVNRASRKVVCACTCMLMQFTILKLKRKLIPYCQSVLHGPPAYLLRITISQQTSLEISCQKTDVKRIAASLRVFLETTTSIIIHKSRKNDQCNMLRLLGMCFVLMIFFFFF